MTSPNTNSSEPVTKCPQCNTKGKKVQRITLESLLTPSAAEGITDSQYRFCDSLDCETVYFAEDGSSFSKPDLSVRVGVKEHTAPRHVCYCFDHTIEEIDAEVRETGQSTVLDDIKTKMANACWCETKSPQGSCCLGTVSKYVKLSLAEQGHSTNPTQDEHADCCAAASHQSTQSNQHEDCCDPSSTSSRNQDKAQRKGILAAGGSVFTAIAASACCWLPLLLIIFGVSAGGVSAWFQQYRWLFLSLTTILLATGFYFVYFRTPHCEPGSACATPNLKLQRFNRVTLWIATFVVIVSAAFPKYVGYLLPKSEPMITSVANTTYENTAVNSTFNTADNNSSIANSKIPASILTFDVSGMTCEACAISLQADLVKIDGVTAAQVNYDTKSAQIQSSSPSIIEQVQATADRHGYKASPTQGNQ